ncbi:unnamed protein product [Musa textilis]
MHCQSRCPRRPVLDRRTQRKLLPRLRRRVDSPLPNCWPVPRPVLFIIVDRQGWWMHKYRPCLMKLSSYDIIDYDNDDRVHCFKHVVVGLRAERDLMIDPAGAPEGYSIMDFVRLTGSAYTLERDRA